MNQSYKENNEYIKLCFKEDDFDDNFELIFENNNYDPNLLFGSIPLSNMLCRYDMFNVLAKICRHEKFIFSCYHWDNLQILIYKGEYEITKLYLNKLDYLLLEDLENNTVKRCAKINFEYYRKNIDTIKTSLLYFSIIEKKFEEKDIANLSKLIIDNQYSYEQFMHCINTTRKVQSF